VRLNTPTQQNGVRKTDLQPLARVTIPRFISESLKATLPTISTLRTIGRVSRAVVWATALSAAGGRRAQASTPSADAKKRRRPPAEAPPESADWRAL
jgi:hypothetical protein